ncbi:MAG TPA: helix-turn-helix domain-containing protein [Candidatus Limnocylindrales bacterium]|nr:helix-turn-helix domain-containing protein [Candidatus Limnocylindrales bacterium]
MTPRGDRTRAKLIEATLAVVAEAGYAHASTRAIATAAGVSEGTIYRHFPDKASLFFAAALEPSASVLDGLAGLPALAGKRTVADNLAGVLARLAELQERVIPLEIAVLSDPELAAQRRSAAAAAGNMLAGPPQAIAVYLRAEQRLGRIRPDLDPTEVAVLLLATLFGLAVTANMTGTTVDGARIEAAVMTLVQGITQP